VNRRHLLLVGMLVAGLLAGATAGPASAARPAGGSKFYGFEPPDRAVTKFAPKSAQLRVARGGRRLARSRSYVKVQFAGRCGARNFRVRLGRRVRIRRSGAFSARDARGARRSSIRGRFLTRGHARVSYRARAPRPGRGRRPCRASGRVELYRNGKPPFSSCRTQRAKTVLRTRGARVFRQLRFRRDPDEPGFYPYLYACAIDNGRRFALGQDYGDLSIEAVRLTDPFVGFATVSCGGLCGTTGIVVLDVRNGSRKTLPRVSSLGPDFRATITDLELKATGAVAWIAQTARDQTDPNTEVREVWASDSAGQRMLDSGIGIGLESLKLSGSTLSWRKNGSPRSATIH
jgi:hypothetical protein